MYINVYIYTWQEYTLNDQQIRAVAPIVYAVDEMWSKRTKSSSCKADGKRHECVNCLWLGAGGSGKTWAYTQVVRPVFRRFFGEDGFVAGAPTHAAVRLLGREARTLHKLANVNPGGGLDRRSLRAQKARQDALERRIIAALAAVLRPRWVLW